MGISRPKKSVENNTQVQPVLSEKFFVDRESQREIFFSRMGKISPEESQLIYYAGAGGIGKSALIEYLEKELSNTSKAAKFKSIRYDFTHGAEMLTVLNALKKILVDSDGVELPLFEKGLLTYYQKCGDTAGVMEIQNILKESKVLKKSRKYLDEALKKSFDASTLSNFVKKIFDEGIEILGMASDSIPILKVAKLAVDAIDKSLKEIERLRLENDATYRNTVEELKKREAAFTPEAIKSYLPILFAKDLSYWLKKNGLNLIIFLDTYEHLTDAEKDVKRHEKIIRKHNDSYEYEDVPVDWWIAELLYDSQNTLWVIAGRGEISKIGEDIDIVKGKYLFPLTALANNFAEDFLKKAGIDDENLRVGITKLTGGYPVYLSLCVDTYRKILERGGTPTLSDFGDKRESVINRLLAFMNDATRNMVKRLCILGSWTDVYAIRVLSILHENNRDTYKRVKKLSFVSAQNENIFSFDRSIQKILFNHLRETESEFIRETRNAAAEFFKSAFYDVDAEENKNISAGDRALFFSFWYEIILRTTDDAEFLMRQYIENLASLSNRFNDDFIEGVIEKFQAKIKETKGTENIPFAYFEHLLAQIKLRQDKIKDALEFAESAYNKFESLPLKNYQAETKFSVISTLADVYFKLERTAAEIELRKKIVTGCENFYRNKTDEHIIDAKYKLAFAFENGDKKNKALEIYAEIYHTLEHLNEERTVTAAIYYVNALEGTDRYRETLPLREKIVKFYRNTNDTETHKLVIKALINLLKSISLTDNAEKILELHREVVTLEEKLHGKYSRDVYLALKDLRRILRKLNRADESKRELEKFADKCKARLDVTENLDEKIELIKILRDISYTFDNQGDVRMWEEKLREILREDVEVKTREPIEDYDAAISAVKNLQENFIAESESTDYRENISVKLSEKVRLQRKILELVQKNPAADSDEIIEAKEQLADILSRNAENYDEARKLYEEVVEQYKAKYPDDEAHEDILRAMYDLANFIDYINYDFNGALPVLKDILRRLEKKNDDANQILELMDRIAVSMSLYILENGLDDFSEVLIWRQRILNFCRENFVEDSPEVIDAISGLASVYESMGNYDEAENLRKKVAETRADKRGDESNFDVIWDKKFLAYSLYYAGKYDEELKILYEIVELCRKNREENGGGRDHIIDALEAVIMTLEDLGREDEIVEIRRQIIDEYKKDYADITAYFGEDFDEAINRLERIADALNNIDDYEEELKVRREIVERLQEKYPDDADNQNLINARINEADTLLYLKDYDGALAIFCDYLNIADAKNKLASRLEGMKIFDAAVDVQNEIVNAKSELESLLEMKENYSPSFSEPNEEIDKSYSVILRKGQRYDLTKNYPQLLQLAIIFGWDADNFEIDYSAFLLGNNGKVTADEDFIFYNNPRHKSGSVEYVENLAQIKVDLKKIPADVSKIAFTLTIYDAEINGQNFSQVNDAYISIVAANREILRFNLNENFSVETAIVAGELYRNKGAWKFNPVGAGFCGGLYSLCKNFGVELTE